MRLSAGVIAVIAIAGCKSLASDRGAESFPARQAVPPELLIPVSLYDIRGEVAPLEESKTLNEPLRLPRLRTTPLPAGVREIRIYEGLVIGYPRSGLLVREENGRVSGKLFRYWPNNDTSFSELGDSEKRFAQSEAGRCIEIVRGKEATACYVRFSTQPDWQRLLRVLDSLNAWNLPDESQVPSRGMVIDGWVIRVEARKDTSYNRYQYHNPQVYRPPEGPSALRLMRIVDSLFRYTVPTHDLRYVRGIYLYGRDTSDFVPCGRPQDVGFLEGRLNPVQKLIGDSAWKARGTPVKAFEIEAWVHQQDGSVERYSRTLQHMFSVESVTVVRQSPTRSCARR